MGLGLALSVALNLSTSALLIYTGVLVAQRRTASTREARVALRDFATWWFAVAGILLFSGAHTLLALAGVTDLAVHQGVTYATAVPVALALWALLSYLWFVYTGRPTARRPLALAYAAFLLFELAYFSLFGGERSLVETPWQIQVATTTQPPAWMSLAFGLLVAVPVLIIVIAYARLFGSTRDALVRRRILLVSSAFGLWFGAVLVAYVAGADRASWFPLVYEAPGLVAGILVVTAYRPQRARDALGEAVRETRA